MSIRVQNTLSLFLKILGLLLFVFVTSLQAHVYDFTEGNKLTLLKEPRAAVNLKLELIKNAKHHIHIMTYYWDKEGFPRQIIAELRKAHNRGVDVRIITTYIPSLSMDFFQTATKILMSDLKKSNSKAVLSFLKLKPGRGRVFTNNVHEKIFLVDGAVAILGGRNISESAYKAKDLEVKLEGPIVNEVQEHFLKMFTYMLDIKIKKECVSDDEIYPDDEEAIAECANKINLTSFDIKNSLFFPTQPQFENGAKARVLTNELLFQQNGKVIKRRDRDKLQDDIIDTVIKTKFNTLRAYNYFVIPTERYKTFLQENLALGKKIEMISNSLTSSRFISDAGYLYSLPIMDELVSKGLALHQWQVGARVGDDQLSLVHEKVLLFDDDHGIIGSHNFGLGSTTVSSEISLEFYSQPIVTELANVFDEEFADQTVTKEITSAEIQKEISENKKMIRFLHLGAIGNFIQGMF